MLDFARLVILLALVGGAVTVLAGAAAWYGEERRRITRALARVLKGAPDTILIARGRGRAVGLSLEARAVAVTWERGAWCLVYRLDELMGAELLVDGAVGARVFREEPRRALERVAAEANEVNLRLIFDDPRHPDFELQLWRAGDAERDPGASPALAVQEANRWMAGIESLLRRPARVAGAAVVSPPPSPPPPPPAPTRRPEPDEPEAPGLFDDLDDERQV